MQKIHPLSFLLGLVSGLLILFVAAGGVRFLRYGRTMQDPPGFGTWQQRQGGGNGFNLSRMAERLGISEADLQKELDQGKTMQQIAQEHGVQFGGGGRGPRGSGTGSVVSSAPSLGSGSSVATDRASGALIPVSSATRP